jgi:hypothetical protein
VADFPCRSAIDVSVVTFGVVVVGEQYFCNGDALGIGNATGR